MSSQSSDSSNRVKPASFRGRRSGLPRRRRVFRGKYMSELKRRRLRNVSIQEQQSINARVPKPDDAEEVVRQQSKATPQEDSGLDENFLLSSRLSAITSAESLKETTLESPTIVTETDQAAAYPYSCAYVADCDQQECGVRVFTPRKFSFQKLLNSDDAECLNSDSWSEHGGVPSEAAANEAEKRRIPDDAEEAERQQSKATPHDVDSGLDEDLLLSSRLSAVTYSESLKETILESPRIVTEIDQAAADTHSCADAAVCDQQGDVAGVLVFPPRKFSFQKLLNSDDPESLNSDSWSEHGGAPSEAAANEAEKRRIPDHSDEDWKEWFID